MIWQSKFAAGTFLVASLTILSLIGYTVHLRDQRNEANAAVEQAKLEAEGFKKALAVKPTEVIKLVPTLVTKYVKEKVKEGVVVPVASGHAEGSSNFYVPCPASADPQEGSNEPPKGTDIHLNVYGNFLITRIRFGEAVSWKGDFGGSVSLDGGEPKPLTFNPEDTKFDILVSKDITKALYDHEREGGWWKRRTALACPGVGLTYNPIDTTRPVNVGITCSYGMVWF